MQFFPGNKMNCLLAGWLNWLTGWLAGWPAEPSWLATSAFAAATAAGIAAAADSVACSKRTICCYSTDILRVPPGTQ